MSVELLNILDVGLASVYLTAQLLATTEIIIVLAVELILAPTNLECQLISSAEYMNCENQYIIR